MEWNREGDLWEMTYGLKDNKGFLKKKKMDQDTKDDSRIGVKSVCENTEDFNGEIGC